MSDTNFKQNFSCHFQWFQCFNQVTMAVQAILLNCCFSSLGGSTAVDSDKQCGSGFQRRHVFCQRITNPDMPGTSVRVPNHHCEGGSADMPDTYRSCQVPCLLDCQVSDWSSWSNCSETCGEGNVETGTVVPLY